MARWMMAKGAKSLVLVSRSGQATGKVADLIQAASLEGASVVVRSCDVSDQTQVHNLFTEGIKGLPEVRGIVHSAMVLNVSSLGSYLKMLAKKLFRMFSTKR